MDIKSCVTALAIAASSRSSGSLSVSSAAIDEFVHAVSGGTQAQLDALRELQQSYDALRIDGETALAVEALIDEKITEISSYITQLKNTDGSDAILARL